MASLTKRRKRVLSEHLAHGHVEEDRASRWAAAFWVMALDPGLTVSPPGDRDGVQALSLLRSSLW